MKNFLVRLNIIGLICAIFVGVAVAIHSHSTWYPPCGSGVDLGLCLNGDTLFGFAAGKTIEGSIGNGLFFPIFYCFCSALTSWLFGAGFKLHIRVVKSTHENI